MPNAHIPACFFPYSTSLSEVLRPTILSHEEPVLPSCSSVGGDSEADLSVALPTLAEYTTAMVPTETNSASNDTANNSGLDNDTDEAVPHGLIHINGDDESSYCLPLSDSTLPMATNAHGSFRNNRHTRLGMKHNDKLVGSTDSESFFDTSIDSCSMNENMTLSVDESHDGNNALQYGTGSNCTNRSKNDIAAASVATSHEDNSNKDKKSRDEKEEEDGGDNESWYRMILIGVAAGLYGLFTLVKKCCKGGDEKEELPEPPK